MKKLYLSLNNRRQLTPADIINIQNHLGIEITVSISDADYALYAHDYEVLKVINNPNLSKLHFVDYNTILEITDKIKMLDLDIPTISTIVPISKEQSINEFNYSGSIFVKHRNTLSKDMINPISYSKYASVAEFANSMTNEFWENQLTSDNPFVIQPAVEYPADSITINISVNSNSEVLVWDIMKTQAIDIQQFGFCCPSNENHSTLIEQIKNICIKKNIKSGIYNLELIKFENEYRLIDWNLRMSSAHFNYIAVKYLPIFELIIAHMMDLTDTSTIVIPEFYYQQRLNDRLINSADTIFNAGLIPRYDFSRSNLGFDKITRIVGIGSKESIDLKFNNLLMEN